MSGHCWYSLVDNSTVRQWSSLEAVPKNLARRVMGLQKFNFRVLFIETRLNLSDWATRCSTDDKPICKYERFLDGRIYAPDGSAIPWKNLFSRKMADEATDFFTRKRNQEMAYAMDPRERIVDDDDCIKEDMKELSRALEIKPSKECEKKMSVSEIITAY